MFKYVGPDWAFKNIVNQASAYLIIEREKLAWAMAHGPALRAPLQSNAHELDNWMHCPGLHSAIAGFVVYIEFGTYSNLLFPAIHFS